MFSVEKHNWQIQEVCITLIFIWETTLISISDYVVQVEFILPPTPGLGVRLRTVQWGLLQSLVTVTGLGMVTEIQASILYWNYWKDDILFAVCDTSWLVEGNLELMEIILSMNIKICLRMKSKIKAEKWRNNVFLG